MIPYRMNPLGIRSEIPLTLTAGVDNSAIRLNAYGSVDSSGLYFRMGTTGSWSSYTPGTRIELSEGERIQFWNSNNTFSSFTQDFFQFSMSGIIYASGNLQSLLNFDTNCKYGCFTYLFWSCWSLFSAPDITANLATRCCWWMLNGTRITQATITSPELQSQSLAGLFKDCPYLNRIEVDFTTWGSYGNSTTDWVSGVAASGTFIKPSALPEEYGANRIPTGWTVVNK